MTTAEAKSDSAEMKKVEANQVLLVRLQS